MIMAQQIMIEKLPESRSTRARRVAQECEDELTEGVLRQAMKATKRARALLASLEEV